MKIGVFDSGIGGLSVAKAIEQAFPEHAVIFRHDTSEHFPYATKSPEEILGYVVPVIQSLIDDGCAVIVVACNTVTTTLIGHLRAHFTTPLVAVEPMIKPAAQQTHSKVIAVCATPTTLASPRYRELKQLYGQGITILEPDCADWSALIEHNKMDMIRLRHTVLSVLDHGADIIVLGCTHYHWIEADITSLAKGRAVVLQPEAAIIRQLKRVIEQQA